VSLTKAPVSAAATTVTGLAAFAAVAMDAGRQFVRHGTVMAHEGAHAVSGSLASPSAAKCSSCPRKGRRVARDEYSSCGTMQQGPLHV
jgi:hypothetical protein